MIFILGANGFVGSGFVRYCHRHNLEYVPVTRENYSTYKGQKCEILVNAAGNSSKLLALQEPLQDFDLNVRETLCTLFDFFPSKYVYLSSVDVYNNCSNPDHNAENIPIVPTKVSRYGLNKYVGELLVQQYASDFLIIRLGGMVGPGLRKNAIYDLTHGGKLYVHPKSAYQYLHSDQVAQMVMHLARRMSTGDVINLCGDGILELSLVQQWLEQPTLASKLRRERYEINISKLKTIMSVPTSEGAVRRYIYENRDEMRGK